MTLDECILPPPCAYCSSADYTWYGAYTWIYYQPECRAMPLYKIVQKLDGAVYIITQFQETVEAGWPCSQTNSTPQTTCDSNLFSASHPVFNASHPLFNASQPTLTTRTSGQCVCESPCVPHLPTFLPPCAAAHTRTRPPFSVATCTSTILSARRALPPPQEEDDLSGGCRPALGSLDTAVHMAGNPPTAPSSSDLLPLCVFT